MKKKDLEDLRKSDVATLEKEVEKRRLERSKLVLELRSGKKKNPKKTRVLKREIAQILTVIREKKLAVDEKNEGEEKDKK